MAGTSRHPDAKYGRMGDTMVAHVERGEQIIPRHVMDSNPALAGIIAQAILNGGDNPERFRVGGKASVNPHTGNQEFFSIGKILSRALPIVIGAALGGPLGVGATVGAGIGGAAGSALRGGDIKQIISGGATGFGLASGIGALSNAASSAGLFGTPTVTGATLTGGALPTGAAANAGALGGGTISGATQGALSAFGSSLYDSAMAPMSAVGKVLQAGQLAGSLFGAPQQQQAISSQAIGNPEGPAPTAFSPQQPDAIARPQSLNELASFSPEQERSALATKGVNTGLGNDEQSYYRNLIQRSLIGEGNKVNVQNPNWLMPIESNYFSRQGLNTSDQMKFLQGLQG